MLLSLLLAIASVGTIGTPGFAQDGPNAESDSLFRQGIEAFDAKRFTDAERLFSEALAIRKASDIAANLASTQLELRKYRDAATNFQLALTILPASAKQEQKTALFKQLATAKAQVITVDVKVNVACEVTVSTSTVPADPGRTTVVFVDANTHQLVTVTAGGYVPQQKPVSGTPGSTITLTVELKPATHPSPSPLVPVWAPITTGMLSAAGIGLGIAGFVLFAGAENDADAAAAAIGGGNARCTAASPPAACADLRSALDDRSTFGSLGVYGLVGGGVLLTATIVLAVLHITTRDPPDNSPGARRRTPGFSATVGVSPTGVQIQGSF